MSIRKSAAIAIVGCCIGGIAAAQDAPPQIPFKVVENFLKLPDNVYMAEVVGVAVDSKGHIIVVHRGKQPILEFNPDGSFVRAIGEGLPFEGPHAARFDAQDNLWYIDAGTNLVMKFDTDKRLQMVLGRR
ncbi:MAG: hypothetical protein QOI40_4647, partial [Alphaproteobacteria bacterium]|nr:hypothetical protein [Alphaproteobacteria bacterium]